VAEKEAGEVGVHTLVTADKLVREDKSRFFIQKMDAKEPEKMPSAAANAARRSATVDS
jgi:hypothetical protein